jgi:glucose/arabinose dehydrogenase
MKKMNIGVIALFILIVALLFVFYYRQQLAARLMPEFATPAETSLEIVDVIPNQADIEVIAQNLSIPWNIVFLPDGDIMITERAGTLKRIGRNPQSHDIEGVHHIGEGGLLGITLHPDYEQNNFVYLYYTYLENNNTVNRVDRFTYQDENILTNRQEIISNIPGANFHNAGKLVFGPDGYLYITTGDAQDTSLSQQLDSLAGKILRVDENGSIPADNPFGTSVYSYGHRNPQGLSWDAQDRLWATEHGPSGNDEINLIERGNNYGWPTIQGDQSAQGMQMPTLTSGRNDTWAPAGIAVLGNDIYFAGLRGQAIYKTQIREEGLGNSPTLTSPKVYFTGQFGRIRELKVHDGQIYITTSNTDGRGNPSQGDDKIIRINPKTFN